MGILMPIKDQETGIPKLFRVILPVNYIEKGRNSTLHYLEWRGIGCHPDGIISNAALRYLHVSTPGEMVTVSICH